VIVASCHCGAITIDIPRKPRTVTDCNCSICRRYGVLWAYYKARDVQVRGTRASMSSYLRGKRSIRFVRCRHCGCVTHWEEVRKSASDRIGVNARNLDLGILKSVRIRHLDGALTWKYLD
jgi:hypothetical protein